MERSAMDREHLMTDTEDDVEGRVDIDLDYWTFDRVKHFSR